MPVFGRKKKEKPRMRSLKELRELDPDVDKIISTLSTTRLFDSASDDGLEIRVQLSDMDKLISSGMPCATMLKYMDKWDKITRRFETFAEFIDAICHAKETNESLEVPNDASNKPEPRYKNLGELKEQDPHVDKVITTLSGCRLFDGVRADKIEVGFKELVELLQAGKGGKSTMVIIEKMESDRRRFDSFKHLVETVKTEGKAIRKNARAAKRAAKEEAARKKAEEERIQEEENRKIQEMKTVINSNQQDPRAYKHLTKKSSSRKSPREATLTMFPSLDPVQRSTPSKSSFPPLSARDSRQSSGVISSKATGSRTVR